MYRSQWESLAGTAVYTTSNMCSTIAGSYLNVQESMGKPCRYSDLYYKSHKVSHMARTHTTTSHMCYVIGGSHEKLKCRTLWGRV